MVKYCITLFLFCFSFAGVDQLKVLVWNLERGSNPYGNGPGKTLGVIKDSEAEVVLMQESYDSNGERPKIGKWHYYQGKSHHLCVISKYPIEKIF